MVKYSKEKNYETALAIILGLLVIWYITHIKVLLLICLLLAAIGLLIQPLANLITWGWTKLSHVLGWVMSKVILSAVFYLFLFPIALLSRLFRKDPMRLKRIPDASYYVSRNHSYKPEDLENPW